MIDSISRDERWKRLRLRAQSSPGRYRLNAAACGAFALVAALVSYGRAWWQVAAALIVGLLWFWLGMSWLAVTWRRERPPRWWVGWVR